MTDRLALLIGTPKGAFVIDGDAARSQWNLRGPLCEGWPIHDVSVEPGTGALLAGGGSAWYGPARLAERGPRPDLDALGRGPDLRRRRAEAHDRLERHRDR